MGSRLPGPDGANWILATAAAVALLHVFSSILWPFALAVVIVIMIRAAVRTAERVWPGASRRALLLMGGLVALALIAAFELVTLPGLAELREAAPVLQRRIDDLLARASLRAGLEEPITAAALMMDQDLRVVAGGIVRGLQAAAWGLILTALFVMFLLISLERIAHRLHLVAGGRDPRRRLILERCVSGVETYVWVQTLTGMMTAGAAALVMAAVGLEHWFLWALGLFLLAYIPFVGVAVGSIAPAVFALLQFSTPWQGVVIFLGIQAVAFVVGNVIWPRLQADKQNIDPSVSLLAVGAWSIIWGLPGAFLAAPVTLALIYQLAATDRLNWIAVLLSHNGDPLPAPSETSADAKPGRIDGPGAKLRRLRLRVFTRERGRGDAPILDGDVQGGSDDDLPRR